MTGGVPAVQAPVSLQVSDPSHRFALAQLVPAATGVFETPVTGSQASAVQALPSSMTGGVPEPHVPDAHASLPLQTVPSLHGVPSGSVGSVHAPVPESHVPAA